MLTFLLRSAALGVGLAMDAFSVSLVDGLRAPDMGRRGRARVAGTFAFFQWLMPMAGWLCVRTVLALFRSMRQAIPWMAASILCALGARMIWEGISGREETATEPGRSALLLQGIATSIDALSAGFTLADYGCRAAMAASLVIASVTFVLCDVGVRAGRRFGTRLAGRAGILGGAILIAVGARICANGILSAGTV